ncbi:hypothetical protein L7F22_000233 [Adiantum nelumboides]|nr:hypothetical protein [Adiantum nelumboides]
MSRKGSLQVQVTVPSYFLCPISLELMRDPVTLTSGQTFDRSSIQQWLDAGHTTCPVTRQPLSDSDFDNPIPNHTLRRMIQAWCVQNKSCGVERILTPRQPPSLKDIPILLDLLAPARSSADTTTAAHESLDALQTMSRLAVERPQSRHSILLSGALPVLTKLLARSFSGLGPFTAVGPIPTTFAVADEALKLLDLLIDPCLFAEFDQQQLHSQEELIMSLANALLRSGMLDSRPRAASILSRLQPSDCLKKKIDQMPGFIVALVEMIKDNDVSTKAALGLLVDVCAVSNGNRVIATEAGAVVTLGKLLLSLQQHDSEDKATTEMILRALEVLCQCAEGRAAVASKSSLLTTIVKQMSAVSERATHHAVHIVLLVVKWAPEADEVKSAALQEGALLKAIAVAQSAAASETRLVARRLAASLSEALPHSHLSHTMRIL